MGYIGYHRIPKSAESLIVDKKSRRKPKTQTQNRWHHGAKGEKVTGYPLGGHEGSILAGLDCLRRRPNGYGFLPVWGRFPVGLGPDRVLPYHGPS